MLFSGEEPLRFMKLLQLLGAVKLMLDQPLWAWAGVGGARIYNLLTQEGEHGHGAKPGRATLANVNHCLKRLRHELEKAEVRAFAMSRHAQTGDWRRGLGLA